MIAPILRLMIAITLILPVAGTTALAQTQAGGQSLLNAWYDATNQELSGLDSQIRNLETETARLETELEKARAAVKADPACHDLNCRALNAQATLIDQVRDAAKVAFLLSHITEQQRAQYAENIKGSISFVARGADSLQSSLRAWELSIMAAEMAAVAAVGVLTGQPPTDFAERLQRMSGAVANFAFNRTVNKAVGHQDLGATVATEGTPAHLNRVTDSMAKSIGSRLSSIAVLKPAGDSFAFTIKPRAANLNAAEVAGIATRAMIHALTDGAVEELDSATRKAIRTHQDLINQHRDAFMVAGLQKLIGEKIKARRARINGALDRLANVQELCQTEHTRKRCAEDLDRAQKAYQNRETQALAKARADKTVAAQKLNALRSDWRDALDQANREHLKLRDALDRQAKAENLLKNKARFELLAKSAKDPAVRERYRQDLKDLESLGNAGDIAAQVTEALAKRKAVWAEIARLEQMIEAERPKTLAAIKAADDAIDQAERQAFQAWSKAQGDFLTCIDAGRATIRTDARPGLSALKATYPGQLFPDDIFRSLNDKLQILTERLSQVSLRVTIKPGAVCEQAQTTGGLVQGCWSLEANWFDRLNIRQSGDSLTAEAHRAGDAPSLLQGRMDGDRVTLNGETKGPNPTAITLRLTLIRDRYNLAYALAGVEETLVRQPAPLADYEDKRPAILKRLRPQKPTSVTATDEAFQTRSQGLVHGQPLYLEAEAEDTCPIARDHIIVEAIPRLHQSGAQVIVLTETAADSGIFHGPETGTVVDPFHRDFTVAMMAAYYANDYAQAAIDIVTGPSGSVPSATIAVLEPSLKKGSKTELTLPHETFGPDTGLLGYENHLFELDAKARSLPALE